MSTDTFCTNGVISASWCASVFQVQTRQLADGARQALDEQDSLIGVIVCKLEPHRGGPVRGYIAMLATRAEYRGRGIATKLVRMAIDKMVEKDADEVCSLSLSLISNP